MADEVKDGLICTDCGVYFANAHGHPAACEACWIKYDEHLIFYDENGYECIDGTELKRARYATI